MQDSNYILDTKMFKNLLFFIKQIWFVINYQFL